MALKTMRGRSPNKNTDRLIKSNIKIYYGHHQKNLKNTTMIVISSEIESLDLDLKSLYFLFFGANRNVSWGKF